MLFMIMGGSATTTEPGGSVGSPVTKLGGLGDSIMDGLGYGSMVQYAAAALGVPYLVSGHSGHRTQSIKTFITDILSYGPSHCVLEGGVNDVASGDPISMTVNNYIEEIDALIAANIIPVIVLILPWTNGTTAENQKVDTINAQLISLQGTYSSLKIVDARAAVGQFRSGGDTGNLWDIKPAYNVDGVHFNSAGEQAIGAKIVEVLS